MNSLNVALAGCLCKHLFAGNKTSSYCYSSSYAEPSEGKSRFISRRKLAEKAGAVF